MIEHLYIGCISCTNVLLGTYNSLHAKGHESTERENIRTTTIITISMSVRRPAATFTRVVRSLAVWIQLTESCRKLVRWCSGLHTFCCSTVATSARRVSKHTDTDMPRIVSVYFNWKHTPTTTPTPRLAPTQPHGSLWGWWQSSRPAHRTTFVLSGAEKAT